MAEFMVIITDPDSGVTHQVDIEGQDANQFLGCDLGDEVDGVVVDLNGFTFELMGGSGKAGRSMHPGVPDGALKEILAEDDIGYRPSRDGERKRVTIRNREVSDEAVRVNTKIAAGEDDVAAAFGEGGDEEADE